MTELNNRDEQGGSMRQVGMQIGAERRLGTATFESVDPYTGEPWATVPEAAKADVDDAVRAARAAFDGEWTAMTGAARGRLIRRLGELITSRADDLADAETRDNGKLLREPASPARAASSMRMSTTRSWNGWPSGPAGS